MWIDVVELTVLGIAVALVLAGGIFIRRMAATQTGITYAVLSSNALYVVVTLMVMMRGYSFLHLLWLFPLAFVAGFLVLVPPFKWILVPLGRVYASVWCIGLSRTSAPNTRAK